MESFRNANCFETEEETPQGSHVVIHVVPAVKSRWTHIDNLDQFFTQIYQYWLNHGFYCIFWEATFDLAQFVYIVSLAGYVTECVNYRALFGESDGKLDWSDIVTSPQECAAQLSTFSFICIGAAAFFWIVRFGQTILHLRNFYRIKVFYKEALNIVDKDLVNIEWREIENKILTAQLKHEMCIHKKELNHLDVYQRILRFDNYLVGFINKKILPVKLNVPFLGEIVPFTHSYKYLLYFLLFKGPWAVFQNSWHLLDDYKKPSKRIELSKYVARCFYWAAAISLLLIPLIFMYQLFYSFFTLTETIKREPSTLGVRRWSLYGRFFLRHFNELDHELNGRLNRAHRPACKYMQSFSSPLGTIFARYALVLTAAPLAILILFNIANSAVWTSWDHLVTVMATLGCICTVLRTFIPDDHSIWCPEKLMMAVLVQVHYVPDDWRGNAHTTDVRDAFTQLFQFRLAYIMEEVLSPFMTPILLIRSGQKALDIVDFFRNFTIDVEGVGDVCSFAVLDIAKHGNSDWQDPTKCDSRTNNVQKAEDGKTEMSLFRFATTHPEWVGTEESREYVNTVRNQIQREIDTMPALREELVDTSVFSSGFGIGFSNHEQSFLQQTHLPASNFLSWKNEQELRLHNLSSARVPPNESLRPSWHASLMRSQNLEALFECGKEALDSNSKIVNLGSLLVHEMHLRQIDNAVNHPQVFIQTSSEDDDNYVHHSETTPLLTQRLAKSS